jgi:hypothetical protein
MKRKRLLKFRLFKLLLVLLSVSFLADTISYTIARFGLSSIGVVNIYFIVQFFLLSLIYRVLFPDDYNLPILVLTGLNITFFIINSIFGQGIEHIQSYPVSSSGALILLYAFLYYRHLITSLPAADLLKYPPLWINSAVAYYFSFTLLVFLVSTYAFLNLKSSEVITLWAFHNFNNIVKNILFAIAVLYSGYTGR